MAAAWVLPLSKAIRQIEMCPGLEASPAGILSMVIKWLTSGIRTADGEVFVL